MSPSVIGVSVLRCYPFLFSSDVRNNIKIRYQTLFSRHLLRIKWDVGTVGRIPVPLDSHQAILGAEQGPFPFPFSYKVPQLGRGKGDRGLLLGIQAGLLQPGRLKAF